MEDFTANSQISQYTLKILILALLLMCASPALRAQELLMDSEDVMPADFIEPRFGKGGFDEFYDFVKSKFDFSKIRAKGSIIAGFAINEKGELTDIRILKFDEVEAAAEMIRVLKLSPNWKHATEGGKPVKVRLKLPFNFK